MYMSVVLNDYNDSNYKSLVLNDDNDPGIIQSNDKCKQWLITLTCTCLCLVAFVVKIVKIFL